MPVMLVYPFLCYAKEVVLLSDTSLGLQYLINIMVDLCISVGLTIGIARN